MGYIADVVANMPIVSVWGNAIRNRTVQQFANAAERAAQWVSPPAVALSVLSDHPGALYYFDGTAWQAQGAKVASHSRMTTDVPMSSPGDLPIETQWTAIPTHTYLTQLQVNIGNGVAAPNTAIVGIHNAIGGPIIRSGAVNMNPSSLANVFVMLYESGLSGVQTRRAQLVNATAFAMTIGGTGSGYSEMTTIDLAG